ncbi:hypothetical protein ACFX2I_015190 [Malus domestica]
MLSEVQVLPQLPEQGIAISKGDINQMNQIRARKIGGHRWWWVAIDCLKKGHLNGSLIGSIIPPLGPRKPLYPIIGFVPYKTAQILFKGAIEHFGLAIGLWMIRQTLAKSGVLLFKEGSPKITNKDWIPITHYGSRHAMKAKDFMNKDISDFGRRVWVFDWNDDPLPRK